MASAPPEDGVLANKMVNFLGKQLFDAQAEVQTLKTENESLEAQIVLHVQDKERLSRSLRELEQKHFVVIKEEVSCEALSDDAVRLYFHLSEPSDSAITSLKQELSTRDQPLEEQTERINNMELFCARLEQSLRDEEQKRVDVETALTVKNEQLAKKKRKIREVKAMLAETRLNFEVSESKSQQLAKDVAALIQEKEKIKAAPECFSITTFLKNCPEDCGQPSYEDIRATKIPDDNFKLSPEALALCEKPVYVISSCDKCIWAESGAQCAVIVRPSIMLTVTGEWLRQDPPLCANTVREFFWWDHDGWRYLGTFKCTTVAECKKSDVRSSVSSTRMKKILANAVCDSDAVAPILVKAVEDLYRNDIFSFVCCGLQCVGFNRPLYDLLCHQERPPEKSWSSSSGSNKRISAQDNQTQPVEKYFKGRYHPPPPSKKRKSNESGCNGQSSSAPKNKKKNA
ncbi:hypothetical protein FISHEDRAFT_55103 [Fistulina hepatica ATCC 64428]|uniref:Uncharacterized protein n=1 Tax=Fistulina hepatica ATCC 64428 TaxID=1128425 RepID=A0A0D7AQH1_9AGAR|nr:hypothetical protein FISHEDRAFT_55103 [Fistulina hepatica ATCC 64428]